VAIMGALLNSRLAARLADVQGAPAGGRTEVLLSQEGRESLGPAVLHAMEQALAASLHEMFFIVLAAGALCLAAVTFFPRGNVEELAAKSPTRQAVLSESADEPSFLS
jgi:hypothetical protein